jgi:hypothetical protein|nr:MAG TPA: hypothetical protein [Caudoviricetes sp.]
MMDDLIMAERRKKIKALDYFEKTLEVDDKHFKFVLLGNELVEVTDLLSGSVQYVNIACDNVPAMIYDILKQAGDWIL